MVDSPTLTIRLPQELKTALEAAAAAADQSATEYVQRALRLRVAGACPMCGRDGGGGLVQAPAFSTGFEEWHKKSQAGEGGAWVTFATIAGGERRVYFGTLGDAPLHGSHVTMVLCETEDTVRYEVVDVPRAHIVMWDCAGSIRLRERCRRWGYLDVTSSVLTAAEKPSRGRKP